MRIVIFGATGNTGLCAVEHCVKKGFDTRVFVRDQKKIPDHLKDKVTPIIGDVTNPKIVEEAVKGRDAVVVALGTRRDLSPTTVLSQGTKNILDAMKANKVELVSVCISAFLFYQPDKVPSIFKDLTADHERMLNLLKESGLKWVAVLPPHIADTPSSKYIVKYDETPGRAISKYDLGAFLVESLEQPQHYQKVCGLATVPNESEPQL